MKISTRQVDDVVMVDMEGRLDSQSAGYSNDEMVRIVKGDHKNVLFNLEKLEFITNAGLRVLLLAAKETLNNSIPGIFQLAAARVAPAPHSMSQWLTPLIHAGASCPGREALSKSDLSSLRAKRSNPVA